MEVEGCCRSAGVSGSHAAGGGGVTAISKCGGDGSLSFSALGSTLRLSQTGWVGAAAGGCCGSGCSCFCSCSRCSLVVTPVVVLRSESMESLGAPLVLAPALAFATLLFGLRLDLVRCLDFPATPLTDFLIMGPNFTQI